ncbi:hypothetical protein PIB30_011189 [Stylosanthes scabra]|uniref:Uncharacterized protein n=1 Tax=Stylosanthes scabra TaxID=79078 RepID=A0ABU6S593_9FABA|nr:hypothetical protein [Stylosanthes scabra]
MDFDSLDDFFDFDDFIRRSPPPSSDFLWSNPSASSEIGFSAGGSAGGSSDVCPKKTRKRGHASSCCKEGTKAGREKLRRERLNERQACFYILNWLISFQSQSLTSCIKLMFCDLSAVLEPGRPAKTDKMAILDDAIRVLKQLKTEAEELKETNAKLLEEIKCSKAEKNELREEKLVLKADKERIERQLKDLPVQPAGYMPPNLAPFQAGVNKVAVYPNYGYMPMWHYLPPSTRDTSHDHELRPPAA